MTRGARPASRALTAMLLCAGLICIAENAVQISAAPQNKSASKSPERIAASSDAIAGRQIYSQQCAACHFASSAAKKIGPGMKGIYRKPKFADGRAVSDANMISWIRNGGKNMPPLASNLNADEIRQVIAYLHTL